LKKPDPTNAARQRRFRERRKDAGVTKLSAVTAVTEAEESPVSAEISISLPTQAVDEPAQVGRYANRYGTDVLTLLVAFALAAVSAGFSIVGMTSVFGGAFWPIVGMGCVLELAKLRSVALIGMRRGSRPVRAGLVLLVAALMGLNAIGAYGFLAKAHIGQAVAGDVAVAGRLAEVNARVGVQADLLSDLDRRLAQIDEAIEKAIQRGRSGSAMALAADQRKVRDQLSGQRAAVARILAELKTERAAVDGQRKVVEAELGPVRFMAALIGVDSELAMRYFILAVSCLLDPAAVLLLLCATRR
jgi:hypothetical protein